ncbi:MAG: hypothetical protein U0667_05795 [Chloroflexota bacterium]
MTDARFENDLQQRLVRRAAAIDTPFDPRAVARRAAARASDRECAGRHKLVRRSGRGTRGLLLAAALALFAAATIATAIVGQRPAPSLVPPERGTFRVLEDPSISIWDGHSVTTLLDGRVLLVAGYASRGEAALWDPATNAWHQAGTRVGGGQRVTTTLLRDGRVLVTDDWNLAETWDPASGVWTATAKPAHHLSGAEPTELDDGRLLFGRGRDAQVFDPATATFGEAGSLADLPPDRDGVELADGRVLTVGPRSSVIWDPASGTSQTTAGLADAFTEWAVAGAVVRLADGRVLAVGGRRSPAGASSESGTSAAAIWDPATGVFQATGALRHAMDERTQATVLHDGRVLVMGEWGSTELFELR